MSLLIRCWCCQRASAGVMTDQLSHTAPDKLVSCLDRSQLKLSLRRLYDTLFFICPVSGKSVSLQNLIYRFRPLNFPEFAVKRMVEDVFFKSLIHFLIKTSHTSKGEEELDWSEVSSHLSSPENVCNNKG